MMMIVNDTYLCYKQGLELYAALSDFVRCVSCFSQLVYIRTALLRNVGSLGRAHTNLAKQLLAKALLLKANLLLPKALLLESNLLLDRASLLLSKAKAFWFVLCQ